MKSKTLLTSLLGVALGWAGLSSAQAEVFNVLPSSGHPLDNVARSTFDIFDQKVTHHGSSEKVWITNFQRPGLAWPGSNMSVRATPQATGSGRSRLCEYEGAGDWEGCTSWTTAYTSYRSVSNANNVHLQTALEDGETLYFVVFEQQ